MLSRVPAYLFDVVVGYQADRLVLLVGVRLLLGLPPVIIAVLFQQVENVALGDGQLALTLGLVVVDGLVDAEEAHDVDIGFRTTGRQAGT